MKVERFVIDPRVAPTIVGKTVYTRNAVTNDLDSQNKKEERNFKKKEESLEDSVEIVKDEEINATSAKSESKLLDILA